MPRTFEIHELQQPDSLASAIANKFTGWESARDVWYRNAKETLENLYATSTRDIYNQSKETDNCTHIPKLTQIRDMIITYYLDAMFSLPDYVDWEAYDSESIKFETRTTLKSVCKQMVEDSKFKPVIRELVEDYVDYGNAFATAINVSETLVNNGQYSITYEGPKAVRIDPMNIFFDPLASSFEKSPKIIRTIKTLGELVAEAEEMPESSEEYKIALKNALDKRTKVRNELAINAGDSIKDDICNIAGLGTWSNYYNSDTVELLTFYGDLYDIENNKLHKNTRIVVMDRSTVLLEEPIKNFGFNCNIFKAGWRDRKDNLWSMSPLDNIKGMQFMVDFLENKRADVFNYISNPVIVKQGDVEMPEDIYPGCEIGVDNDGAVTFLRPDATALQADLYVDRYMTMMEEMVGAPREAMGFRSPGEKTAFEVSQLNTASSRLFNEKTRKFELEMLEPLLTLMLRIFLSNPNRTVKIRNVMEDGTVMFDEINLDELSNQGRFVAMGSNTYTEKARIAQTLMQIYNSGIVSDPLVFNYFDPKIIAKAIAYTTGLDSWTGIMKENARTNAELDLARSQEFAKQQLEETQVRGIQNAQQGIM
jgi:hypothetical protein